MRYLALGCSVIATMVSATHAAAETITYTYDAKGRLTQVQHAGGRNDGLASSYVFDAADNRARHDVTGANATTNSNPLPVVVVPLNGFRVIAIPPDI